MRTSISHSESIDSNNNNVIVATLLVGVMIAIIII